MGYLSEPHIRKANLQSHQQSPQDITRSEAVSTNQSLQQFDSPHTVQLSPTDATVQITPNEDPQTPDKIIPSRINLSPSQELPGTHPSLQSQVILFENSGNTCYVNSLLHCLLSISSFRLFYLQHTETITLDDELKQHLTIIPAMKVLLQRIYHCSSTVTQSQVNAIHLNLIEFIQVISSLYPDFRLGNQGDQHQLFQLLIEWTV